MGAQTFYPETVFGEGGETSSKAKSKSAVKNFLNLKKR